MNLTVNTKHWWNNGWLLWLVGEQLFSFTKQLRRHLPFPLYWRIHALSTLHYTAMWQQIPRGQYGQQTASSRQLTGTSGSNNSDYFRLRFNLSHCCVDILVFYCPLHMQFSVRWLVKYMAYFPLLENSCRIEKQNPRKQEEKISRKKLRKMERKKEHNE